MPSMTFRTFVHCSESSRRHHIGCSHLVCARGPRSSCRIPCRRGRPGRAGRHRRHNRRLVTSVTRPVTLLSRPDPADAQSPLCWRRIPPIVTNTAYVNVHTATLHIHSQSLHIHSIYTPYTLAHSQRHLRLEKLGVQQYFFLTKHRRV